MSYGDSQEILDIREALSVIQDCAVGTMGEAQVRERCKDIEQAAESLEAASLRLANLLTEALDEKIDAEMEKFQERHR